MAHALVESSRPGIEAARNSLITAADLFHGSPFRPATRVDHTRSQGVERFGVLSANAVDHAHVSGLGQERVLVDEAPQRDLRVDGARVGVITQDAIDAHHAVDLRRRRAVQRAPQGVVAQPLDRRPGQRRGASRPTTDATAPGLTPRLLAVSRWLRGAARFSRRISRIFRIGTRSVAIRSLTPPWDKGGS